MRLADPTGDAMFQAMETSFAEVVAVKRKIYPPAGIMVKNNTGENRSETSNEHVVYRSAAPDYDRENAKNSEKQRQLRQYQEVKRIYCWSLVTERTEEVYHNILAAPKKRIRSRLLLVPQKLGYVSALLYAYMVVLDVFLAWVLKIIHPAELVQVALPVSNVATEV
ncbi:unnamed protein product [Amoebophrya sp. A120]|nr:unnamed protein product [Amoebophrya sp. A120]|eukprot:GSA120T00012781001.1